MTSKKTSEARRERATVQPGRNVPGPERDRATAGRRVVCVLVTVAVLAAAVVVAHLSHHLDWFWTGQPADIIGGNGLQLGDLHLFIH